MTKSTKFFALFLTLAMVCASAATYSVTFFQTSQVNGNDLKPGDYKLILEDNKITITKGKQKVEAAVKVENGGEKFQATSVRYTDENGKAKVQEIRLGGTTTKVVLN